MVQLAPGSAWNGTTPNAENTTARRGVFSISLACGWLADPLCICLTPSRSRRVPGAGSFIRLTPSIKYGTTFRRALLSKYVEDLHGSQGHEFVVLGSSNGAIEVEAVNLDKIRNKLSHVEKLREVSLDGENVASADPPGEIGKTCPSACFRNCILFGCRFTRLQASAVWM